MNILFDYDGTLYDSAPLFAKVFRAAYVIAVRKGWFPSRDWSDAEVGRWLGYNSRKMRQDLAADLTEEEWREFQGHMVRISKTLADWKSSSLFPGVHRMLQVLMDEGHRLFILSNCRADYIEQQRELFGLDKYFDAYYCSGDFDWRQKFEIFPEIRGKFPGEFIIVGDRRQDIEIARRHDLRSIGCRYGYGDEDEIRDASVLVDSPREIPRIIQSWQARTKV